jgi:hypothetical protein
MTSSDSPSLLASPSVLFHAMEDVDGSNAIRYFKILAILKATGPAMLQTVNFSRHLTTDFTDC